MGFGLNQTNKPTPKKIADLLDLIASILGLLSGFLVVANFIPKQISDIISPILTALFIPVCLRLKQYFGSDTEQKKIPIDKVDVVDDTK